MPRGKVKWFNKERHFGFIIQENGKDIFFHQNDVANGLVLKEGQEVEFEVERSPKGPKAVHVRPLLP
ncbi:cold shock domain-containing protein [Candidatus Bipolaricaulota bacterium]|nr:cold shock domain-containing protein [Candidatus Bipolaricaulota bacterium]